MNISYPTWLIETIFKIILKGDPKKMFPKEFFSFFTLLVTLQVILHFRISSIRPSWRLGCLSSWSLPLASLVWSWWDPYTECCCWRFGARMLWFQLSGLEHSGGLDHLNPVWLWPRHFQLAIHLPSLVPEVHEGSYDVLQKLRSGADLGFSDGGGGQIF